MKRVPIHLIRQRHTYTIEEIATLLCVHKNTVRQWRREGLVAMDNIRPTLIYGAELNTFLLNRRSRTQSKCKPDELFCCKCRAPRKPWEGLIDVTIITQQRFRTHAICEVCCTPTHRAANPTTLVEMLKTLHIQQVRNEHLIETMQPSVKCYFGKE